MSLFRDPVYLASDQYKDAANLDARIQLHQRYSTNPYGWFRWLFEQLDLPAHARILEVGCGSGRLWIENLARLPQSWRVTLSDFSPGMAIGCHAGVVSEFDRIAVVVSDAMAIPCPAASFDAVLANHMLYHVPNLPHALAEIARVLKPRGTLYASTNGENHLLELDDLLLQGREAAEGIIMGKPSRAFSLENGAAQLAQYFSQVELRKYQDSLIVTQAEPLLAYIHSMLPRWGMRGSDNVDRDIVKAIKDRISQQGSFHIQKSSGVFIARK